MGDSTGSVYPRSFGRGSTMRGQYSASSSSASTGLVSSKPRRPLSSREVDERRANNLCFYCDEKYFPGHKCSS